MGRQLFLVLSGVILLLAVSCKKEVTKTEVVTVRDTVYVHDTTLIPGLVSDTTTTLILLRHAEKENAGSDPDLNSAGIARAEEVARLLSNVPVSAIYSTPFKRTRQTVQPLAAAKGINTLEYDPNKPYSQLVAEFIASAHGKVAVIVGHTNTVPDILRELSNNTFNITIGEEVYDNLFIVTIPDDLPAVITHLKYGEPTP